MTTTTDTVDVPALLAENARLRAIVDRVEALASGARLHWNGAPTGGTLAVVEKSGGWQDLPPTTRTFIRDDQPGSVEGGDWFEQAPAAGDKPWSWGELNWLDDPECDRGSVSIETYVSVDALDAALSVKSAVAA